jgi:hypothetical protein
VEDHQQLPCYNSHTTHCACQVCSHSWCWTKGVASPAEVREWLCRKPVAGTSSLAPLSILMSSGSIPLPICMSKTLHCTSETSQALPLVLWTSIWVFSYRFQICNRNLWSHNTVKGVWWYLFPFYSASHQPHVEKAWANMYGTCSPSFCSLTFSVLHIKYSGIVWMRKLCGENQEKVKYIFNFSIILCNTLPLIQYWKPQKALTQTPCRSGIEWKAATVHCTASTSGNAFAHLCCESQKRPLGDCVP